MEGNTVKLNIKMMNQTISIEVDKGATVNQMKQKIKEQTKAEEADQKLIYKGRILKDEDTLETHNIQSGDSLHLVVKKKPTEAPKPEEKQTVPPMPGAEAGAAPTGMPGMGMPGMGMPGMGMPGMGMPGMGMPGMMDPNNPLFQTAIQAITSNPEMMRFAINSNPYLGQMVRQNPELEYILSNPEMLRTIMTPENIRMAMGMMQNMRGAPGAAGANPLFGMGMPGAAPGAGATTGATTGTSGTTGPATGAPPAGGFPGFDPAMLSQMMAGFGGAPQPGTSAAPPTSAAPSATGPPPTSAAPSGGATGAWQQPPAFPFGNFAQMMRMFSPPTSTAGTAGTTGPAAAPVDPKVKYATQLEKLKEMGFTNEEVNLEALKATNGNVDAAVERILSMLQ